MPGEAPVTSLSICGNCHIYTVRLGSHTAVFDAELDAVSVLFLHADIFSVEKQPCKHTFRRGFRLDFPSWKFQLGNRADSTSNSTLRNSLGNPALHHHSSPAEANKCSSYPLQRWYCSQQPDSHLMYWWLSEQKYLGNISHYTHIQWETLQPSVGGIRQEHWGFCCESASNPQQNPQKRVCCGFTADFNYPIQANGENPQ